MKRGIIIALVFLIATAVALKGYANHTAKKNDAAAKEEAMKIATQKKDTEIEDNTDIQGRESIDPPKTSDISEPEVEKAPAPQTGPLICIDAGHQARQNTDQETVSPSSSQTKAKVAAGTKGVATGIGEYEFTLRFSRILKEKLESEGFRVAMVRDSHDVDISNQERAQMANALNADLYLRIHANGINDSSVEGIETYYASENNPDVGHLSRASKRLSTLILEEMARATGAKARYAQARDDLTGTNFATMPTSLIECGYMTNPEEDRRLNDEQYLNLLADGIVLGVKRYYQA